MQLKLQEGKIVIRKLSVLALSFVLMAMLSSTAFGATYPTQPVNYLIAFSAGGESDITARMQQKYLEKELGVPVVMTYKVGGGGAVCWADLVRSKADGYIIGGVNEPHTILQPLQSKCGYETEQIQRIALFQYTPCALIVKKDSQFKTLKDLIDFAKKYPGMITVGGSGSWASTHFTTMLFEKAAGIKLTYIPFAGSGDTKPTILGGHVSAIVAHPTTAMTMKDDIRILAVAAETRSAAFPDVPTFKELGFPTVIEGSYRGVAVPPGTPKDIVDKLAAAFKKANEDPEFVKQMTSLGFDLVWKGPEEYENWIKGQTVYYRDLLKSLGYQN